MAETDGQGLTRQPRTVTREEWEAYLDEALPPEEMVALEVMLREDESARELVREIIALRDAGVHSVAAIWRRHRVSCPSREELGSYLLGLLDEGAARYIECHVRLVGCRFCLSNLDDLRRLQNEDSKESVRRRQGYFNTSVSFLQGRK